MSNYMEICVFPKSDYHQQTISNYYMYRLQPPGLQFSKRATILTVDIKATVEVAGAYS